MLRKTAILMAFSWPILSAHAGCIVADPTPTPLNIRTAPNGRIIGTIENGQSVNIIDHAIDNNQQPWVYISDSGTPLGWVFRKYIICKGELGTGQ